MYRASKDINEEIDLEKIKSFLNRSNLELVDTFGLYGGEISENLDLYQKVIDILPKFIPRWCITNGSWSKDLNFRKEFVVWCLDNKLFIVVSGTWYHKLYQDKEFFDYLKNTEFSQVFRFKSGDKMHAMGKLVDCGIECSKKCLTPIISQRVAILPNGDIIFQWCDGNYPVIGRVEEDNVESIIEKLEDCINKKTPVCHIFKKTMFNS
jgi:hypothetical protein